MEKMKIKIEDKKKLDKTGSIPPIDPQNIKKKITAAHSPPYVYFSTIKKKKKKRNHHDHRHQ